MLLRLQQLPVSSLLACLTNFKFVIPTITCQFPKMSVWLYWFCFSKEPRLWHSYWFLCFLSSFYYLDNTIAQKPCYQNSQINYSSGHNALITSYLIQKSPKSWSTQHPLFSILLIINLILYLLHFPSH